MIFFFKLDLLGCTGPVSADRVFALECGVRNL